MSPPHTCVLPVLAPGGQQVGSLQLQVPPHRQRPNGGDVVLAPSTNSGRTELLEDGEYRYRWEGLAAVVSTDHPDLFIADDTSGHTGRLCPGRSTGIVVAKVYGGAPAPIGTVQFEVRSRKLGYENEYRWMLRDLTQRFTDLVMQRFAAGQHRFAPNPSEAARSTYQRFAFLASLLSTEAFDDAMRRILAEPHVTWKTDRERRTTSAGVRLTGRVQRHVVGSADRVAWPAGRALGLPSLPRNVVVETTQATTDNPPNRFVRFALESFRAVASRLRTGLDTTGAVALRGTEEADQLIRRLDGYLGHPVLRHVGTLRRFPSASQVLQKKAGYRDLLRAYLLSDVAASLTWTGGDEVYGAGKRNVAALYEYWVYLELAGIVGDLCGQTVDLASLVEASGDGLSVRLESGQQQALTGNFTTGAAPLELALHFNRRFGTGRSGEVSWSRPMQPDCSLEVRGPARYDTDLGSTWLHFDAKYRIDGHRPFLGPGEAANGPHGAGTKAKRADLLKMHAYRDAIVRSAGAYVLYPGDAQEEVLQVYHEVLPGLGAFPLRPSARGRSEGSEALRSFLREVLLHLANRSTSRERARYWQARAHSAQRRLPGVLRRPPADTLVGLGFVRSENRAWCHTHQLYVVRADRHRPGSVGVQSAFLRAEFLVIYGDAGDATLHRVSPEVEVFTRDELVALAYSGPGGRKYFGLRIGPPLDWASVGLSSSVAVAWARAGDQRWGAPVVASWAELEPHA